MSIMDLAFHDAATNCARDGATAFINLRSGVVFAGELSKPKSADDTLHMRTDDGGWVVIRRDEVAAVRTRPRRR